MIFFVLFPCNAGTELKLGGANQYNQYKCLNAKVLSLQQQQQLAFLSCSNAYEISACIKSQIPYFKMFN